MAAILSSDGGKMALLRRGKIFRIGEIEKGHYMAPEGELAPCKVVSWDFYENGHVDVFYYDLENNFLFACINPKRPQYLLDMFSEVVSKGADLNKSVVAIQSRFITKEMGF